MAKATKKERKYLDKALIAFGVVTTVVMVAVGVLAYGAYSFTTKNVHDELVSQKIFFPPKGSPALDPAEFPGLQQYAGQQVDNGPKAKAFANEFIAVHLQKVAGGLTYSQASTKAMADPTNVALQGQVATLFKGETLRGLLLGDAYAFWTVGSIAKIVAYVAFAGAAVMGLLVILGLRHLGSIA